MLIIRHAIKNARRQRDGAMLPIIAVVIVILFIAASLAVDIARMHVTRSELRTATDAAARAASESLAREQDPQAAIDAAIAIAARHRVAGSDLTIEPSDVVLGSSVLQPDGRFSFVEGTERLNAVRVAGRRTADSPDGTVGLLFGPVFGVTDFEPIQTATAASSDRDIALVLDVSGSMANQGKFEALGNAVDVFLAILEDSPQNEHVSLTVYSDEVRKPQVLTPVLDLIRSGFASESPGGFTAIGRGLTSGLDSIQNDPAVRPFALKSIIVMTDGQHNRGVEPSVIARQAADEGIVVHAVTFSPEADRVRMQEVADLTGGMYLHADTNEQLVEVFETIARSLAQVLIE